jgi:hypothetical protein
MQRSAPPPFKRDFVSCLKSSGRFGDSGDISKFKTAFIKKYHAPKRHGENANACFLKGLIEISQGVSTSLL